MRLHNYMVGDEVYVIPIKEYAVVKDLRSNGDYLLTVHGRLDEVVAMSRWLRPATPMSYRIDALVIL